MHLIVGSDHIAAAVRDSVKLYERRHRMHERETRTPVVC